MTENPLNIGINWEEFLSRHDLTWPRLSYKGGEFVTFQDRWKERIIRVRKEWFEGAFIGNGMIGAVIHKGSPQELRWELGRNGVTAKNHLKGIDWMIPRVPIGDILMIPAGKVVDESMRLSLWDAEASGRVDTESGTIEWRSVAHAEKDLMIIEVKTTGGEKNMTLGFRPQHGISPRIYYSECRIPKNLLPPPPLQICSEGVHLSIQTFIKAAGEDAVEPEGECAVAWKEVIFGENYRVFYVSIKNSLYDNSAREKALETVRSAINTSIEEHLSIHKAWWHRYYPNSFLSLPDTVWESFYWIQMYKLASAIRNEPLILDVNGPWLTDTTCAGTWWNLNIQLSYMPMYTSNRLLLAESLIKTLAASERVLIDNAKQAGVTDGMYIGRSTNSVDFKSEYPGRNEIGNLLWTLHCVWRHYRCSMDEDLLKDMLFPFLKRSVNLFLHLMYKGEDGKWHLPRTYSPEYPVMDGYPKETIDCNYNLSLFRWGCQTLLYANERLGLNDPLASKWQNVLENLVDYPEDENGFMVGAEIPFATSHRHYSHILMFYPLHLISTEQREYSEKIKKTVSHWSNFEGALQGYSYTGATAMAATMGEGNKALEYLEGFKPYIMPNTMYGEGNSALIETPLSCAESIHYLLLQSWGDTVRVFPAVPEEWKDVVFHRLLAEGAFEVSARRCDGKTQFVYIRSLAGSPLKVMPNMDGAVKFSGSKEFLLEEVEGGIYSVNMEKGEYIILYTGDAKPELNIEALPAKAEDMNFYGAGH